MVYSENLASRAVNTITNDDDVGVAHTELAIISPHQDTSSFQMFNLPDTKAKGDLSDSLDIDGGWS